MPSIELKVDTTQAQSNVEALKRSMDGYIGSVQELASQGKYTEAAQQIQQMAGQASQSLMQQTGVKPGTNGAAAALLGNTNNQELRTLDARLESVNRTISELTKQLEATTKAGQYNDSANIATSLNSAEQERNRLEREKALGDAKDKKEGSGLSQYFGMKEMSQMLGFVSQGFAIQSNYRKSIASGNGLEEAQATKTADIVQTGAKAVETASTIAMLVPEPHVKAAATAVFASAEAVDIFTGVLKGIKQADIAEANAYTGDLRYTHGLNKLYSSEGKEERNNNISADSLYGIANEKAINTNLSVPDFLSASTDMAKYGYGSAKSAMEATRQAALFAYGTGSDLGSVQSLMGTVYRYGGKNGEASIDINKLNTQRIQSGLDKSQTGEFLNSLQRVIENGISEGYIKSTEDVASTMKMFNTLSGGNELWRGEQGVNRMLKMGNSIASATALQDTNDVLVFEAAQKAMGGKAGSYVDVMAKMEQGIDPEMFKAIAQEVFDTEGDDMNSIVERFKNMYGTNYTTAIQLYEMANTMRGNGEWNGNVSKGELNGVVGGELNYESAETRRQNLLSDIQTQVYDIGQRKFGMAIGLLEKIDRDYRSKNGIKEDLNGASFASPNTDEWVQKQTDYYTAIGNADDLVKEGKYDEAAQAIFTSDNLGHISSTFGGEKDKKGSLFSASQWASLSQSASFDSNNFLNRLSQYRPNQDNEAFDRMIMNSTLATLTKGGQKELDERDLAKAINLFNSDAIQKAYSQNDMEKLITTIADEWSKAFSGANFVVVKD